MKPLISTEEFEKQCAAKPHDRTPGYPTGIACPECGEELFAFIGGSAMLEHYHGRRPVFCRGCGHESTIPNRKTPGEANEK